ncbi:MAG: gliding motility-associated C-terminal domain-containing protein [Elusimicrobiota bacterium]
MKIKNHFLLLAAFLIGMSESGFAFQSVSVKTVGAAVVTGGVVQAQDLKIQHTPLTRTSEITKEIIIVGEAGQEVPPGLIPFISRTKPGSDFGPEASREVRIRIQYRFIPPPSGVPGQPLPSLEELAPVEGSDPIAFAFQIPSDKVVTGTFQYRIVAERIRYVNGTLEVLSQITFPKTSGADPDPFISLGVQANAAQVFGIEGGRFDLVDGNPIVGNTTLDIPAGILHGPTTITIDEIPLNSPLIPPGVENALRVYKLEAQPLFDGLTQLAIGYPDFTFPNGQDGLIDGTNIPVEKTTLAWWDGFQWRIIGGSINRQTNTISVRLAKLNFVALLPAGALTPEGRRPMEKIITPNGDGTNDSANFVLGDITSNVKIDIFDMTGHRIKTVMSNTDLQWDGRDENGKIVESGVYIYQYTVDGQKTSGLIAVAK